MEEGDLGLGLGLKPGAISTRGSDEDDGALSHYSSSPDTCLNGHNSTERPTSRSRAVRERTISHGGGRIESGVAALDGPRGRLQRSNSVGSVLQRDGRPHLSGEEIPSFAGVAMGTSLRQQRELFQRGMKDFLDKKDKLNKSPEIKGSAIPAAFFAVQKSLVDRLQTASEEVVVLQNELEACRSQLDSKYRAIRILQSQVVALSAEKQRNIEVVKGQAKDLQKEVNALQFELDAKSSTFTFSEQTWAERLDRLSTENTALLATLQARSDEVRRLHADRVGLMRERDELLAMLDVNERLRYDRHWSPQNDTYVQNAESEQLAVLGSCLCRGNKPEPCKCAKKAAMLKRENSATKDEVFELQERLQEAYLVADTFRKAFEEQLNRNSSLSKQLADSSSGANPRDGERNGVRRKSLLAWLKKGETKEDHPPETIGQLLAETMGMQALMVSELDETLHSDLKKRSIGVQVSQPMPALIRNMAELLNDKSEALAHQRLVTKMLARRTQDLEATMKKYSNS